MISPRKFLIASSSVAAAVAGLAVPAAARPPAIAAGSYTASVISQDEFRVAGAVAFIKEVDINTYAGDLVGAATDTYTFRLFPNHTLNGTGTEICNACTLGGRTGGYTAIFRFRASGDTFTGTETFLRGTGGLTGLRGGGSFEGSDAGNTYHYSYHFEH